MKNICIICHQDDILGKVLENAFKSTFNVIKIAPKNFSQALITVSQSSVSINNSIINGFFFLVGKSENLVSGFTEKDTSFCNMELKSTILAILHHDSIYAINKYQADLWFEGMTWSFFRILLRNTNISVSDLSFGTPQSKDDNWFPLLNFTKQSVPNKKVSQLLGIPYSNCTPANVTLFCRYKTYGFLNETISQTVDILNSMGISMGAIQTDQLGKVMYIDTTPPITDVQVANDFSTIITKELYEYCINR